MIGRTKLSTIQEELRRAFAAADYNPIFEMDREIREMKESKFTAESDLENLETFRAALARVVEEPKKPAKSKRVRTEKKAI